ncbi:MAG: SpoIIE family protein phosphatase [Bacteroidales bacterium]|nr:SpoIIE family protein phosphatase [Bacteroidales bacterium]
MTISMLLSAASIAQDTHTHTPDSDTAIYYNSIALNSGNIDTMLNSAMLSLEYCAPTDYQLIASNYYNISKAYYLQNEAREALTACFKALHYYTTLKAKDEIARCYILIAKCYFDLNIKDSIFVHFDKALNIYTLLKDTANLAYTYQSIGAVNSDLGFYSNAREYYSKALQMDSLTGNYLEMAFDYQNLGFVETETGNRKSALRYLNKSVSIYDTTSTDDPYYIYSKYTTYMGLASAYISFAKETQQQSYADSCHYYIQKVGDFYIETGNYSSQLLKMIYQAQYLSLCGKHHAAIDTLIKSKQYLESEENIVVLTQLYNELADEYEKIGDYKNAFINYTQMHNYQMSLANDSIMNEIAQFKAEQEGKFQQAENQRLELEKTQLKTIVASLIIVLAIAVLSVIFIMRALKTKHRANEQLSIANRKIYSSITYAERIQKAVMPAKESINAIFQNNFVFYQPRDIVSGDFYYVTQCGRYKVLVTADCTGHGIPGALLSMLGISALKEFCVTEQDAAHPGSILDRMRNFIKSTLISNTNSAIGDGMDMTIFCFDFEAMELRYAAANQMALLIRDGNVTKLKGDPMPVGRYVVEKEHFNTHCIPIEKGDMIYGFSDGIQDQPGGERDNTTNKELAEVSGKKFSSKGLIKLLADHYLKPLDTQREILDNTITTWRNGRLLIDDMTLIGIRV